MIRSTIASVFLAWLLDRLVRDFVSFVSSAASFLGLQIGLKAIEHPGSCAKVVALCIYWGTK